MKRSDRYKQSTMQSKEKNYNQPYHNTYVQPVSKPQKKKKVGVNIQNIITNRINLRNFYRCYVCLIFASKC